MMSPVTVRHFDPSTGTRYHNKMTMTNGKEASKIYRNGDR
jgi:hypothetical protein